MISLSDLIFPAVSKISTPICSRAFVPASVGDDNFRSMFLMCVPASVPFIPAFAIAVRAISNSCTPSTKIFAPPAVFTKPPFSSFARPPTVRNASPNCSTFVLPVDAAFAISSTICVVLSREIPNAVCVSVTISDARARSMPPAAARFRTFGSISIEVSASYPARAM